MPFLTVHGCPVRYDRTGNGPAVVLLHGGGLDSARLSWAPLTPRLAMHVDVIAPDLLACAPYGVDPRVPGGRLGWLAVHTPASTR